MSYAEKNLIKNEVIIYNTKLHWCSYIFPILISITSIALMLSTNGFFVPKIILLAVGLISLIFAYANRNTSEFVVTNQRVLIKVGFIRRRSLEILLDKIESIRVSQGIRGRVLGYGTIIIGGMGGTKEYFHGISDPLVFRRQVQEQAIGSD